MYCHSCNVEFDEGLRYCKWCGQHLTDRPRVTSELNKCHNCAAAVQPTWAFCKACGIKLSSTAETPEIHCPGCGVHVEPNATSCLSCGTALLGRFETRQAPIPALFCPSCGLDVEPGATFCKSCGAILTRGGLTVPSAGWLPCHACGAQNPQDAATCNQCAATLDPSLVDRGTSHRNANTIPDLSASAGLQGVRPITTVEHVTGDVAAGGETLTPPPGPMPTDPTLSDPRTADAPTPAGPQSPPEGMAGGASAPPAPLTGESTSRLSEILTLSFPAPEIPPANVPLHPPHLHDEMGDRVESEDQMREARMARAIEPIPPQPVEPLGPAGPHTNPDAAVTNTQTPQTGAFFQNTLAGPPPFANPAAGAHTSSGNPVTAEVNPPATRVQPAAPTGPAPAVAPPISPAKKGGSKAPIIILIGVILLLALVGGGYFAWRMFSGKLKPRGTTDPIAGKQTQEIPAETPSPAASPSPTPTPAPVEAIPQGMVAVPAGAYSVGREDGDQYARPVHTVDLAAFYIDRTEVTNADYKKFCIAAQHDAPADWKDGDFPTGHDDWPVTMVTWQDAIDYATWAGKRLPTEVEWEAAARGPAGLLYPWGNVWDAHNANIQNPSITSVGQFPTGASFCGALDMIGNVWEWTADEFTLYPGSNAPRPEGIKAGMTFRVIRGGAYDGNKSNDATYRGFVDGAKGLPKTGFRCVKSAPAK